MTNSFTLGYCTHSPKMSLQLHFFLCVNAARILDMQLQFLPYQAHAKSVLCIRSAWVMGSFLQEDCWSPTALTVNPLQLSVHTLSLLSSINHLDTQGALFRIKNLYTRECDHHLCEPLGNPKIFVFDLFSSLGNTDTHSHMKIHSSIHILTYVNAIYVNLCEFLVMWLHLSIILSELGSWYKQ